MIEKGFCQCGCGRKTNLATKTVKRYGHVKGEPVRFIKGHHTRTKDYSQETRAKIGNAVKTAWAEGRLAGRPHTQESKDKIGAAFKRYFAEHGHPNTGKTISEEQKAKFREKVSGEQHWRYKGGYLNKEGYKFVIAHGHPMAHADGYILEHRLVAAEFLGRVLEPHEQVHHINGVKDDNRIENLTVLDGQIHGKWHGTRIYKETVEEIQRLTLEGKSSEEIAQLVHQMKFEEQIIRGRPLIPRD